MALSPARVGVFGASGYTGGELLRLLSMHSYASVVVAGAASAVGAPVASRHPHLATYPDLTFTDPVPASLGGQVDAALLALPHEESAHIAPALCEAGIRVVDLSGAFRLPAQEYPGWYGFEHPAPAWVEKAVYGLPELFGDITDAQLVANPGCYPTATLLALSPLLHAGVIGDGAIVIDAKSGISGAGRTPTDETHFVSAEGSVRPYQAGGAHRHVPEMRRYLGDGDVDITFVPHLVPASRGLLATCYAPVADATAAEILALLADGYASSPFIRVLDEGAMPDTKRVTGSNMAEIGAVVDGETAVVACAIDNLVKGAAGQAVQNLNLMFGFPETAGLDAPAVYP